MSRQINTPFCLFIIILISFSSCKTNEFSSNGLIQKRKHLKGYHFNFPTKIESRKSAQFATKQVGTLKGDQNISSSEDSRESTTLELTRFAPTKEAEKKELTLENEILIEESQQAVSVVEKEPKIPSLLKRKVQKFKTPDSINQKSNEDTNDIFALLSMIFGICSLVFLATPLALLSFLLAPAAIILGFMGLDSSRRGMAITGIVTGFVFVLLIVLILALFLTILAMFI